MLVGLAGIGGGEGGFWVRTGKGRCFFLGRFELVSEWGFEKDRSKGNSLARKLVV